MDTNRFVKTLQQILPYLIQRKFEQDRMRGWLEKSLREYEAWGEQQSRLGQEIYGRDAALKILSAITEGAKTREFPGILAATQAQQLGLPLPEGVTIPAGGYEEAIKPYENLARELAVTYRTGQPLSEDLAASAAGLLGSKGARELLSETKGIEMDEETAFMRMLEYLQGEEERKVRKEELEVRKGEGKGEGAKELKKALEKAKDERDKYVEKYAGVGSFVLKFTPPQEKLFLTKIAKFNKEIRGLEAQLGLSSSLPTDEDYKKFQQMAIATAQAGQPINWHAALMQGFDPSWIVKLKTALEKGK